MSIRNERQKSMRRHLKRMLLEVKAAKITKLDVYHEPVWCVEDSGIRRWSISTNRTLTIHYTIEEEE